MTTATGCLKVPPAADCGAIMMAAAGKPQRLLSGLLFVMAAAAAAAAPHAAEPRFRPDAWFLPDEPLLGFVEIPPGAFLMGSSRAEDSLAFDNEQWSDGSGRRTVDLPAFYMARYEVTVAQFRAFVQESSFRATEEVLRGAGEQPVANVSWPDALAYVRWIDARLRGAVSVAPELSRMLNDGWRVSLPSEAQWEKAARGSDGRRYPWGNVARPGLANFRGSARHSVGSFACGECAFGLADMSGNVWEWTRTPYVPGPYQVAASPLNLEEDALWIMRGGSYTDEERNIRTSVRGGADPGARRPFIGFRLALTRL